MSLNLLLKVIYVFILLCSVVQGTLTPSGTVPSDCGSQQTFTCSVTGGAAWTVSGFSGISVTGGNGLLAANNNTRITTTDTSGVTQSSTITITGLNTSDDGGTIQCIELANNSVQGMASISVGHPYCSDNVTRVRIGNFTRSTVTWQQPPSTPPVTSTTVTYCPTSSPNCGNSVNCPTSPCTISGLDPCMDYNITLTPTNNCGSATGCTGSMVAAKGIPSCPNGVNSTLRNNDCDISLTWQQPPNTPPVTFTTVTYCPTSSPNCGASRNCTSPCTISELLNNTEYKFTVIPNNNCGSPTGCTGNTVTHNVVFHSEICSSDTTPTTGSKPPPAVPIGLIIGAVLAVVLLALIIVIIATILICCFCCKPGSDAKNKPPREEQPRDDYADPQTVRDNKEMIEGNGITYAALQFSEEAGGNGKNGIHCKEELGNVQYSEVEHLQV